MTKILVVEDEGILALVICNSLKQDGYEVCRPVATGEAAIESAARERPEAILMDVQLSSAVDGIQAAEAIRAFLPAPIVFMTGYPNSGRRERAAKLPATVYLEKPVDIEDIEAALGALLTIVQ